MSGRKRSLSPDGSTDSLEPSLGDHTSKFHRLSLSTSSDHSPSTSSLPTSYTCSLPPTCHIRRSHFPTLESLEGHHATHHAHVCSDPLCGMVFPDQRFLELHLMECHDPLVEVKREKGEKTVSFYLRFFYA